MGMLKEKTPLSEIQEGRAYAIMTSDNFDPITGHENNRHEEIIFIEKIRGENCYCWNMTTREKYTLTKTHIRFLYKYRPDI